MTTDHSTNSDNTGDAKSPSMDDDKGRQTPHNGGTGSGSGGGGGAAAPAWIWLAIVGLVVLVGLVYWIEQEWKFSLSAFLALLALLAIIGVFPAAYFAYRAYRQAPLIERLKREFDLMGLVELPTSTTTVEDLYNIVHSSGQYYLYITLIVVLSLFVFLTAGSQPASGSLGAIFSVMDQRLPPVSTQQAAAVQDVQDSGMVSATQTITNATGAITATGTVTLAGNGAQQVVSPGAEGPQDQTGSNPYDDHANSVLNLILLGYLGAYFYAVRELTRRYNTNDLQPQVYASILMRMLAAIVLVFVGSSAIVSFSPKAATGEPEAVAGYVSLWAPAIIAFLIGAFPDWGIRWFKEVGKRVLGPEPDMASTLPIQNLLGISQLHASRLEQMGIDDAQNLAGEDMRRLLLTTPFAPQVIVNWIDQAILFTKVGSEDIKRYRDAQITSFYELQMAIVTLARESNVELGSSTHVEREKAFGKFATLLGMADVDELIRVSDYANFPNYYHIREYYANVGSVIHNLAVAGKDRFIGVVVAADFDAAISEGDELVRNYGADVDPIIMLGLGEANYRKGLGSKRDNDEKAQSYLQVAEKHFSDALGKDAGNLKALNGRALCYIEREERKFYLKAVQDCTRALRLDRSYVDAINTRAIAHKHLGENVRCLEDIQRALELDRRLPGPHYMRGLLHISAKEYPDALDAFERAFLAGYDESLVKLGQGTACLQMEQYQQAVDLFSDVLFADPGLAEAYAKRGAAYRGLAEKVVDPADQASKVADYLDRADQDLKVAVEKDDRDIVSHYNIAQIEAKRGNLDAARVCFQKVVDLDPAGDSAEAKAARFWLNRNVPA